MLGLVIPNAGCGVDEFMLAEVNEKTGGLGDEKAGADCAPNEKPAPEDAAGWPNVNMLGVDEVEPNGLLKAAEDEAVVLLLNILVLATVKDEAAEELGDENANPLPDPEKAAPDPNGELPNTGPEEEVVAPKDTVPGPDEEGAAPKDTAPGPDDETPAPNEKRPGPDEEAPTPIETLPGPDEEAPTPKDTVPGPDEDAPAPNKVPGPDGEAPAPKETVPDPDEDAAAPVATIGNEELNCVAELCDTAPCGCGSLLPKIVLAADA